MRKKLILPDGKTKCVTLSFDDEIRQDFKLVEIINKYGLKSTFNLNSGTFGMDGEVDVNGRKVPHVKISGKEARELYKGHEAAAHTVNHPNLCSLSDDEIRSEVLNDMKDLSSLFSRDVCGMAYPYGAYDERVVSLLKECGVKYCRTVENTYGFGLPDDFLMWHPTMHFGDDGMMDTVREFLDKPADKDNPLLLYIWGHSYELDGNDTWDLFEEFCRMVSGRPEIWYAANIEVYNAVQ